MPKSSCSDEEFVKLFETLGATETSKKLGINERSVHSRRRRLEGTLGRDIYSPNTIRAGENPWRHGAAYLEIEEGTVVVFSDAHYWPNEGMTTAHAALLEIIERVQPAAVVANGDILDGASISKYPASNWENVPPLSGELAESKLRLGEIQNVAGGAHLFWPLGNHDARFEMKLANVAHEYADIDGVHLKDHFPDWVPCNQLYLNAYEYEDGLKNCQMLVTHNWANGVHARRNNTLKAGVSYCTGHTHRLGVTMLDDVRGRRYGVETGSLASAGHPAFGYTRGTPVDWQFGFALLTFYNSRLLQPELVEVIDTDKVVFRGEILTV